MDTYTFDWSSFGAAFTRELLYLMSIFCPIIMSFCLVMIGIKVVLMWVKDGAHLDANTNLPVMPKRSAASLADTPGPCKPVRSIDWAVWLNIGAQLSVLGFLIGAVIEGNWGFAVAAVLVFSCLGVKK